MSIYIPGYGSGSAKLIVCGEAGGKQEEEAQRPFVGPTGQETRNMLRQAGMSPESCWFTNVFKYHPPGNKLYLAHQTGHTIEEGIPELWEEFKALTEANCILALGNLALSTITGENGITKWRGSILPALYHNIKVVPSIHPANLFERRGEKGAFPYSSKIYMQLDFNRAVEESLTRELELPRRNLNYAKRFTDVYDFLQRNRENKIAALDTEGVVPFCISIAFSRHAALSIPLFNLKHFDKTFDISGSEMAEIWRLLDAFFRDESMLFIGQNFKYDQRKLECLGFRLKLYVDTMILGKTVNPEFPGALEFFTSIYTREPYYKDEWQLFDMGKRRLTDVLIYNARDAAVTFEVYECLMKELVELGMKDLYFEKIQPLHDLYHEMEGWGFKVDFDVRDQLYSKYVDMQLKTEDELFELIGYPINCGSVKQIRFLLYEQLKLPKRFKKGVLCVDEDVLVALSANAVKDEKRKLILGKIIDVRRIKNARSKIAARVDYDGRMRTSYRIVGTEAGRTSTAILKKPVRAHEMGMSFHSITKHGDLGGDIRRMFVSDFE